MTYTELAALIEAGTGLPCVLPGAQLKAFPCVTLEPTGITLRDGLRVGFENANVVVRYPLAQGDEFQFEQLNTAAYDVLSALIGTRVLVGDFIELVGDPNGTTPNIGYVFNATFPGIDFCPPPPPEPEPEPKTEE